jgi:osmotically-inducible protein OsmY
MPFKRSKKKPAISGSRVLLLVGASVAAAYFLDPSRGKSRRARLQQRVGGVLRRGSDQAGRKAQFYAGKAQGVKERATGSGKAAAPANDQTLVAKIQSEVLGGFGSGIYPKEKLNVTVEEGVVTLRGEVDTPDQAASLEQEIRKVSGVLDVRSFLHLPGEVAPNKAEAIQTNPDA